MGAPRFLVSPTGCEHGKLGVMSRHAAAPELRTERLVLKGHALSDFEDLAAMWADPEIVRFIGGRPSTREESWARLMRYGGFWSLLGYGFWCARTHEGRYVGDLGLLNGGRDLDPPFGDTPEAGWSLAPWAQGQGFAAEAMRAVLAWADANGIGRTVCMIEPGNGPSVRLAERLGYAQFALTRYHGAEIALFERG
nr:GNAT family N-acetyltransferase [Brevundimonas sp.]